MTWLLWLGGWFAAGCFFAPFVGCRLKHHSPTDAPQGRNGDLP